MKSIKLVPNLQSETSEENLNVKCSCPREGVMEKCYLVLKLQRVDDLMIWAWSVYIIHS